MQQFRGNNKLKRNVLVYDKMKVILTSWYYKLSFIENSIWYWYYISLKYLQFSISRYSWFSFIKSSKTGFHFTYIKMALVLLCISQDNYHLNWHLRILIWRWQVKIIYLKLPFDVSVLRYTYLRCTEAVFTKSTLQMQACTLQIFSADQP